MIAERLAWLCAECGAETEWEDSMEGEPLCLACYDSVVEANYNGLPDGKVVGLTVRMARTHQRDAEILARYKAGESHAELAAAFRIGERTVSRALRSARPSGEHGRLDRHRLRFGHDREPNPTGTNCRVCQPEKKRAYYQAHRAEIVEKQRAYRKAKRDRRSKDLIRQSPVGRIQPMTAASSESRTPILCVSHPPKQRAADASLSALSPAAAEATVFRASPAASASAAPYTAATGPGISPGAAGAARGPHQTKGGSEQQVCETRGHGERPELSGHGVVGSGMRVSGSPVRAGAGAGATVLLPECESPPHFTPAPTGTQRPR